MRELFTAALLATAVVQGAAASAQMAEQADKQNEVQDAGEQTPADTTPDDGKDDDSSKFFWFHKAGVSPATARTDIEYCALQVSAVNGRVQQNAGASFGLIGALVGGIINGVTQSVEARRMRDVGMRRCMALYGYDRYALPEAEWNTLRRGEGAIERLVAFTAAPEAPKGEKLPS